MQPLCLLLVFFFPPCVLSLLTVRLGFLPITYFIQVSEGSWFCLIRRRQNCCQGLFLGPELSSGWVCCKVVNSLCPWDLWIAEGFVQRCWYSQTPQIELQRRIFPFVCFPSNLFPDYRSLGLPQWEDYSLLFVQTDRKLAFLSSSLLLTLALLSNLLPQSLKHSACSQVARPPTAAPSGPQSRWPHPLLSRGHRAYSTCASQSRNLLKNTSQIPFCLILFILQIVVYSFNDLLM